MTTRSRGSRGNRPRRTPRRTPRPGRGAAPSGPRTRRGFSRWYLLPLPTVSVSVVLAAAFITLFASSTWIAVAVLWMAFMASLPISGMAVALVAVSLLPVRAAAVTAAVAAIVAVPAALWSGTYLLNRIDGGAAVLRRPATVAAAEVWTLAVVLGLAAALTLVAAAAQAAVDFLSGRGR